MRKRMHISESDGLLKGAGTGALGTAGLVIFTELSILGGVASGLVIVPAAAYGGYKIASWLHKS